MTIPNFSPLPTDFSSFQLDRVPADPQLLAWNAADELLLARLNDAQEQRDILIVNDSFGALAVALGKQVLGWWQDSAMARQALLANCPRNNCPIPTLIDSADQLPSTISCVAMQIPKSTALFEWQLSHLAQRLSPDGKLYALGMVKHLSEGHQKVMQRWFGHVNPGRAVKKARCVELAEPVAATPPQAQTYRTSQGVQLICEPGCFSAQRPDPGALAFLACFNQLPAVDRVLDLGCGNGILALSYLTQFSQARAIGIDESAQAIASAFASASANQLEDRLTLYHNNSVRELGLSDVPLVLCNPPFHQDTSLTDTIAEQMIQDAANALASNGEFWMVGNRHLNYHQRLTRYFNDVTVRSAHPKFVVISARGVKHQRAL
ncbi:methyltransferase [Saccharospirillum mangrovi]|uniref:methyltransferase n=1 Tax=Saccharospirillum mangrovi TaxID=2161747 RepID=UPI000D38CA10|nr:methyltransferase [Saccharospirillum mangrovi]